MDCTSYTDEMALKTHLFYSLPKDAIIGFHQTNTTKTYMSNRYAKFALLLIHGISI